MSLLFPSQTPAFLNAFRLDMAQGSWLVPVLNGERIEQGLLTDASRPRFVEACRTAMSELRCLGESSGIANQSSWAFPGDDSGAWSFDRSDHPRRLSLYDRRPGSPLRGFRVLFGEGADAETFDLKHVLEPVDARGNPGVKITAHARPSELYGFSFHLSLEGVFVKSLKRFLDFRETTPLDRVVDSLAEFIAPDTGLTWHTSVNGILLHLTWDRMDGAYGVSVDGMVKNNDGKFKEFISLDLFVQDPFVYRGEAWRKFHDVWHWAENRIQEAALSGPNNESERRYSDLIASETYEPQKR